MQLKTKMVFTDVLIIGGGTAGCAAALRLGKQSQLQVLVVEKANIRRSGCLAAGVNAINAYINPGQSVEDMVAYARQDAAGILIRMLSGTKNPRCMHGAAGICLCVG